MKKLFNYIAAAAALTLTVSACSDVFAPAESSTQPQTAGAVEIIISNVTDNSFDVTIAPKGNAAYYSYLVDNDEYYDGIDAASLYAVKYESVMQGSVKYGADNESVSFTVETDPNTNYTVYAIAGSPEGNLSEIAHKTILTSDNGIPELEEYEFQENMIALVFNEEVEAVEGKKITATAYAKLYLTGAPVIASTEGKILQNKDGVVIVQFEEIKVPGTFYIVSYEEGTFTDLVGNPCPALEAGSFKATLKETDENDAAKAAEGTLWAYLENADFEFDTEDIPEAIVEYNTFNQFKSEQMLAKPIAQKVTVSVVHSEGAKTTTNDYALKGGVDYGVTTLYTFGVKLPEEPAHGDLVTISIDKGAAYDIYGNANAACEVKDLVYSYGYKLEDIYGEYENDGKSGYGSDYDEDPWTFVIEESDDAEKGNVMITEWYGFDKIKIYADFDVDLGTLTMPIYYNLIGGFLTYLDQARTQIGLIQYYTFAYYSCSKKQKNDLILYMTEPGKFTDGNDIPGYYYEVYNCPTMNPNDVTDDDYLGSDYNIFAPVFTKVEAGSDPGEGGEEGGASVFSVKKPTDYRYYHQPVFKAKPGKTVLK